MTDQVQCAECLCTLYFVEEGVWGITGELCDSCERKNREEGAFYDDDDD